MAEQSLRGRDRPSIDERAERRRALQHTYPDRYTGLLAMLRNDRAPGGGRLLDDPARWHPIMRRLVLAAVVIGLGIAVVYVASDTWRQGRVDAWSGPGAPVTSGQLVLDCLPESTTPDDRLPTWIRYEGRVYARTDFVRPLRNAGRYGETGQVETDHRLDRMRLMLLMEDPRGVPAERLLVVVEPGPAATLYQWAPDCE
jgi:hypothetical protein